MPIAMKAVNAMVFSADLGHNYLLIGGLISVGTGLLIISLIVNLRVAHSVRHDVRHREKLLEYYRNTFSQLGAILIGIGVSLFIFFFQQNYQDQRKRDAELQQALAKMALRIARSAALMESLAEFDALLDDGGPYVDPEKGGANRAVAVEGTDLATQVSEILLVERDVDVREFEVMNLSRDFESSIVVNELDPELWFSIVRDESDIKYSTTQLGHDYRDLLAALGGLAPDVAVLDPEKHKRIKNEVLDIFYDADLLRQRARSLLGRTCWLFSHGHGFPALKPAEAIEADAGSHREWLEQARPLLTRLKSGSGDCYTLLRAEPTPS
ncbi:hypothetical protein MRS76_01460 [Rhizobiaceae bacterium n13]|uniref:Uncharacterized protein n=1 Tax=Ferirhizobium litorale TaxID=2927786 RepID=A0AAE3U296_9HYPH|nr:hypothetical protein [Fererhizobium litorale]MDI7860611.1 hypothetical protein [Fererhizobium litorale]MDI7920759.1 hypothetical protein [Fererhizobium litorale]